MKVHPDKITRIKDTIKEIRGDIRKMEMKNDKKVKSFITSINTNEDDKEKDREEKRSDYGRNVHYTTQMSGSEQLMLTNGNYNEIDLEASRELCRKYNSIESVGNNSCSHCHSQSYTPMHTQSHSHSHSHSQSHSKSKGYTYNNPRPTQYTPSNSKQKSKSKSKPKPYSKTQYFPTISQDNITITNPQINTTNNSLLQSHLTYDYSSANESQLRSYLQQLKDQNYLLNKTLQETKIANESLMRNQSKSKTIDSIKSSLNEESSDNVLKKINELKGNEKDNKIRDELILKMKNLYKSLTNTNKDVPVDIKTIWKWINHLIKTVKEMYNEKENTDRIVNDLENASMYREFCLQLITDYQLDNVSELKGFIDTLLARNNLNEKRIHKMKKVLLSSPQLTSGHLLNNCTKK